MDKLAILVLPKENGMRRWILLVALIAAAAPAAAERVAGVRFESRLASEAGPLELTGAGLLRYLGFKGYAAAFYLGEGVSSAGALADVPRRLEIEYFRAIPAHRFVSATSKGIEKNLGRRRALALAPEIEQFSRLYADVEPGDRYALTYLPGRGTELSLNGQPLGRVDGADFSKALFSIWLGPAPFDAGLKAQLLGRRS